MNAVACLANFAWAGSSWGAYSRFRRALVSPEAAQRRLLQTMIRRDGDTAFGREHRLGCVGSWEQFRSRVPVRTYDEHAPWIDRVVAGEERVLCADKVTRLMPSSGSTRAVKLIPYTPSLQAAFNRAIGPWMVDLFWRTPRVMGGAAYWSVSPAAAAPKPGGAIEVGFEDDTAYLGGARQWLAGKVMAAPNGVRHLADIETFRYTTLRFLLARRDLRLISVWHPSFLTLLLDCFTVHRERLIDDLCKGTLSPPGADGDGGALGLLRSRCVADPKRGKELAGITEMRALWPGLEVVSCWADAGAEGAARALADVFPTCVIQPKGLLATEGFVSVPIEGKHPLCVLSHVLEFEDDEGGIHCAHELKAGETYGVVLTNGAGLWRYRLGDRVRCDGWVGRTPSIRFVGRADLVVDRFGEKLSEAFVSDALRALLSERKIEAPFAMLAPEEGGYTLFLRAHSAVPNSLAEELDAALSANPHYAYCRRLGQLAAPQVAVVGEDAYARYVARRVAGGQRLGDVKAVALSGEGDWRQVLGGVRVRGFIGG